MYCVVLQCDVFLGLNTHNLLEPQSNISCHIWQRYIYVCIWIVILIKSNH